MSGIVGIWDLNGSPVNKLELDRFTDALAHRGPDGRGTYIDPDLGPGLGHRRLAILDLTDSGHQPMSYGSGRYWITYNGKIYNFIELRKELEGLGHRFCSESDTEVILAAYAQWGEVCQFKFNGMWAFAIWDSQERKLFLSRDRFGVKPLYFLYDGKHFIFASELKAFMALDLPLRPELDLGILASFTNLGTAQRTFLKNVNTFNGGHQLVLRKGRSPEIQRWWRTSDHLVEVPTKFEDQVAYFKDLFLDACRIRMRSDVPIGTSLSGGLDSSSVLCSMAHIKSSGSDKQRLAKSWKKAFVLDFTGTSHSEKHRADEVIRHVGAIPIYKETPLSSISPKDLIQATFDFEAVQDAVIGPWYLYREMRNNGTFVSMDGSGGDSFLTGEAEDVIIAMQDAIWPWKNKRWLDLQLTYQGLFSEELELEQVPRMHTRLMVMKNRYNSRRTDIKNTIKHIIRNLSPDFNDALRLLYYKAKWSFNPQSSLLLITPKDIQPLFPSVNRSKFTFYDAITRKLYIEVHYQELTRTLRNFERISMAHGVESRSPFMDWRLACYNFSLPSASKVGAGSTKRILRESMRSILPESIRLRKSKMGNASPMIEWYQTVLKTFVLDSINSREFLESEIWKGPVIRDFVEDCYRKKDYRSAVTSWKYIQTMILMQSFRDRAKSQNIYGGNR